MASVICVECGTAFEVSIHGAHLARFCSKSCKNRHAVEPLSSKACAVCRHELPPSSFYSRKNGRLSHACKQCVLKSHKVRDKATGRTVKVRLERTAKKREMLRRFKEQPCVDCGQSYPYFCMDADHGDPEQKSFVLSNAVTSTVGLARFRAELEKCEVRCAICHRKRTHREGQY